MRNKGLGMLIHERIKNSAKRHGAMKLMIGVVEQNAGALHFLMKLGYMQAGFSRSVLVGAKKVMC